MTIKNTQKRLIIQITKNYMVSRKLLNFYLLDLIKS